jgi:hypothetical protein
VFISKYDLQSVQLWSSLVTHIAMFLLDSDGRIRLNTLLIFIDRLTQLILDFKALNGIRFISSSICLSYDATEEYKKVDVKLIDFARAT